MPLADLGRAATVHLGRPNSEPQRKFFESRKLYTCYGGARGGGKSWAVRTKAVGGALRWPGIRILIIRRTYRDMENSLITPLVKLVPPEVGRYNATMNMVFFTNGSTIKFGHLPNCGAAVEGEYQGQEFDWIFIDEATQFTEGEFRGIGGCLRGVNDIPKRMYLTCNPGGVGHNWVKRLFVDRRFRKEENPDDYVFIPARYTDNADLMRASPTYGAMLDNLPENVRRAHRDGDWNALAGQYFPEFDRSVHTVEPFAVPPEWKRYRAFDYGLDCFACLWIAVDFDGRCYVYREAAQKGLIVSAAAELALSCTPPGERVEYTIAPPDMWSTQKDTGRTMAEIFAENGLGLVRGSNSRVQGWMALKELLRVRRDGRPGLVIFRDCRGLIEDLQALQTDEKNPSDAATEPHAVTHRPDALRYFAQGRALLPERLPEPDDEENVLAYDDVMRGGLPDDRYLIF